MLASEAELEIERIGRVISAAEPWSKEYEKDPDSHAQLITAEGRLEKAVRKYLRELANDRLEGLINWYQYLTIKAYDIDVTIKDDVMEAEPGIFVNLVFDPLAEAIAVGAVAGQAIYEVNLGMSSTSDAVQTAARRHIATLVTQINEGTRNKIRNSLSTSVELGEDQKAASKRVNKIINDPKRAQTIARTEAVNSYSTGLDLFAIESGAVSSTWQAVPGACPICSPLDGVTVGIGKEFPSIGRLGPTAHPNCRCGKRLNYENHV